MKMVYVLEDDLELLSIIEEFLSSVNFRVKTFSDYRLFFDAIRLEKPDIILLDLMLPMIEGTEVLKYVKSNLYVGYLFLMIYIYSILFYVLQLQLFFLIFFNNEFPITCKYF